jgi:hypothetical protein
MLCNAQYVTNSLIRAKHSFKNIRESIMAQQPTAAASPQDHIKNLQKSALDGDIKGMADSIGELHAQWGALTAEMQSDVHKLEAIFLTILQARTKKVH